MDEFDDLDSLLELESGLHEDAGEGSLKRSRADLQSQQDAARSLAGPPDGKRARVAAAATAGTELDDEELLALAMQESEPASQLLSGQQRTAHTFANTEEQHLFALAMADSQQLSQSVAGGGGSGGGARSGRTGGGSGGAGGADEDFDVDALLDELLGEDADEVEEGQPQGQADGAHAATAPGRTAGAGAGAAQQAAAPEFLLPRRQYVAPAKEVYRIQGASLTVTSETGERVYCQLQAPQPGATGGGSSRRLDVAGMLRRARGGLLSENITSLLAAVEKDQYDRAVAESAAARHSGSGSPAGQGAAQEQQQRRTPGSSGRRKQQQQQGSKSSLWVEKYAPRGYVDLLSDEQINREVVRWIKNWDPCVFGTAAPDQLAQQARGVSSRFQRQGQQGQLGQGQQGGGGGGGSGSGLDDLGRPEQKIILIAGPPGLGKTTLAHVCAVHCGYRPVEINASDDRSGGSLQAKILDAVEMQSVMGGKKPNLVIIDEIDGATGGAEGRSGIAALLKIVNATAGKKRQQQAGAAGGSRGQAGDAESDSEGEEEEEGAGGNSGIARLFGQPAAARRGGSGSSGAAAPLGGGGKPAKQQLRPLMRPIICICNDLYAPALRPLRDVARVFHFKKPMAERLAQRLQSICATEGLRCEKSTLRLLVERTDCDIRSCLNTLQFLSKKQCAVRQADLEGLRVGMKDMTKGAFAVWTELLQKRKAPGIIGRVAESEGQRVLRLYDTLQDFGESELVMGGIHENVLGMRYFDMALTRTSAVLNALGDVDTLLRACHRSADFGLLKFLPAPLVAASSLVAGPDRPQLQWPRAVYDTQRRAAANSAMLQQWMLGMSPAAVAATSTRSLVLEVLPSLMHITAPALRPVSQHLYSPAEQEMVRRLVDTLLCYNLRYCLDAGAEEAEQQEATAAGQEAEQQQHVRGGVAEAPLRFRPAVHRACTFPGMGGKGRQLPAAVRQTISHEADMEAIRRAEAARRQGLGGSAAGEDGGGVLEEANRQRQAAAAPPAALPSGPVPLTLAERMKAAGTAASVAQAAQRQAAAPKGTWLDKLKEQRMAKASARGGAGGEGGAGTVRQKFPVLYRFHEGYTNAVKRPVLMRDLLR